MSRMGHIADKDGHICLKRVLFGKTRQWLISLSTIMYIYRFLCKSEKNIVTSKDSFICPNKCILQYVSSI